MIEEAGLKDEVEVRVRGGAVIISSPTGVRKGWAEAARKLTQRREVSLLDKPAATKFDEETFIVAPLTTGGHPYPFRLPCSFQGTSGHVVLDQIRTVDRERLVKRLGPLSPFALAQSLKILREMFAP